MGLGLSVLRAACQSWMERETQETRHQTSSSPHAGSRALHADAREAKRALLQLPGAPTIRN